MGINENNSANNAGSHSVAAASCTNPPSHLELFVRIMSGYQIFPLLS